MSGRMLSLLGLALGLLCGVVRGEDDCEPVRWLAPQGPMPRNGVLAVSIHRKVLAEIEGIERGQASLRDQKSGARIALDRVESMGGPDGDYRLYVFRPTRELAARQAYRFEVKDVELPELEHVVRTSGELAGAYSHRPPRVRFLREESEGPEVRFAAHDLEWAAWVVVELQLGRPPDTEGADEQEFYRWNESRFFRVVPVVDHGEEPRIVLSTETCRADFELQAARTYRARFSLVSRAGFISAASAWLMFRAP